MPVNNKLPRIDAFQPFAAENRVALLRLLCSMPSSVVFAEATRIRSAAALAGGGGRGGGGDGRLTQVPGPLEPPQP